MLAWFESDGTTPLGALNMGVIGPGESYTGKNAGIAHQVVLKNTGATNITDVTVTISQIASYPANEYALIATGVTQPESGWVDADGELEIGTLEPSDAVNIWVDMSVPLAAPRQMGQLVNFRAAGAQQ